MKFLFDSNILIPAEPTAPADIESKSPVVIELMQVLEHGRHQVYLHPESHRELTEGARDPGRAELRRLLLQKYIPLPSPPRVSAQLKAIIGDAEPGSNDAVDDALLAAVYGDAVDYLVTEDTGLLKKGKAARLGRRVLSAADALAVVRSLFPVAPPPPPAVERVIAHELDGDDPIFDSFRSDYYPDFDEWLRRCKLDHRSAWIIRSPNGTLAAVTIIKAEEEEQPYGLSGRLLKICSFKVSDGARGFRFGELLLKSIFGYVFSNQFDNVYVTAFEKYAELIELFEDFGFHTTPYRTGRGEVVLSKPLKFRPSEYEVAAPLDFNIRYGPSNLKTHGVGGYVIPIKPVYHRMLFPDAEEQMDIIVGRNPFGNGIRKAYLCHANVRRIRPGDPLLFYRSGDQRLVRCVGVAEETLVSGDADKVARFVGQRTVYDYNEIVKMCRQGGVLAILFRHARTLEKPLDLGMLTAGGVLNGAPQSIVRVRLEAMAWLRKYLGPWP